MTPADRPSKTAADEAAIAAGREKHEAPIEVTPVVIEKVAAVVQNATDAAATLVTEGLKTAADKVEGREDKVAQKLETSNAEDREERREESSRRFWQTWWSSLPAIIAAVGALFAAWRSNDAALTGRDNNNQIRIVHKKVNSSMQYQLELTAESARKLADGIPTDENLEAARIAEEALAAHLRGNEE